MASPTQLTQSKRKEWYEPYTKKHIRYIDSYRKKRVTRVSHWPESNRLAAVGVFLRGRLLKSSRDGALK